MTSSFEVLKELLITTPVLAYSVYLIQMLVIGAFMPVWLRFIMKIKAIQLVNYVKHLYITSHTNWQNCRLIGKKWGAFAILYALQKLYHYLHDTAFVIKTDKTLKNLMESTIEDSVLDHQYQGLQLQNCM